MKIKIKLFLGLGILFTMITLLTILSTIFVNRLSADTKNILVANYNTIDYSRKMLIALNNDLTDPANAATFYENLAKQQANVTEPGEQELTMQLTQHYKQLLQNFADGGLQKALHKDVTDIMLLNMEAIQRKSNVAEKTVDNAFVWIGITGGICFLIAFTLLINLPGNVADPIKELTESIQEIAAQNYSRRVHFDKQNEFGDLARAFNTMAKKLEEYKASNLEKLMIEKKRIETLINNMTDPVIGLDEQKNILFMNNVALQITGLQNTDTLGKPAQDIAVRNDLVRSLIQDLFSSEQLPHTAPVKIFADNKESYFEKEIIPINIVPTGETAEKLIGNVIMLRNVTPYKELDFAKTNFIATVSHELKTPISAIKMSVQLLENKQVGLLNEEQQSLLESIKDDASRLLKITGELLNMTQVESGSIQLSVMPGEPAEIIGYAVNANKTAADAKHIKLDVSVPADAKKVLADTEKTAWVLNNLISNAIRYSYEYATIFINVTQEGSTTKFVVKDSGQGIPPQYVHKIFDRYFKVPGSKKEGTGLGLSISKEFIEAQGGHLAVESDLGSGSTFTIVLQNVTA
ncbi:HAMP domain-containing protein [Panacibacter sp. DH6]|uniref:histidine kinase n=1 Tax=Panacibacter microcysteis TaxID=2793269 RepID=A0A931GX34_9BACT|nr:ATP-binding protein [Panacibacter microcysteis]MBG9377263.1 HAMP domain-containing protein [Panacibacter microcysteis]